MYIITDAASTNDDDNRETAKENNIFDDLKSMIFGGSAEDERTVSKTFDADEQQTQQKFY
jgi:hypothetical protein